MYIISLLELCQAVMPELVHAYYQLNPANSTVNSISDTNPRKQELIAKSVEVGHLVLAEQFLTIEDRLVRAPVRTVRKGLVDLAAMSATFSEAVANFAKSANELPSLNQLIAQDAKNLQTEFFEVQHLRENMVKSRDDIEQYRVRAKQMGVDLCMDMTPISDAVISLDERYAHLNMKMYRALFRLGIRA